MSITGDYCQPVIVITGRLSNIIQLSLRWGPVKELSLIICPGKGLPGELTHFGRNQLEEWFTRVSYLVYL